MQVSRKAMIIGVSGQDGTYLAEQLLEQNYAVIGVTRDIEKSSNKLPVSVYNRIELYEWDMLSQSLIDGLLEKHKPSELYNFAAYTTGSGMFEDVVAIGLVNGISVCRLLEAIRTKSSNTRFCQASSAEMFGETSTFPQNESTIFNPKSPYGITKLYAHTMVGIYRDTYHLHASSVILFNHESPRRALAFVSRKITQEVAKIKLQLSDKLVLGNIDVCRDWGYAADYVRAMHLVLGQESGDDYVVASGKSYSIREFCEIAFGYVGLDYKKYVIADSEKFRPNEIMLRVGDSSKIREKLGWYPRVDLKEMIEMMVEADLDKLRKREVAR